MSKFNNKNAVAVKEIKGFCGIDTRSPGDGEGKTKNMVNYRILSDGSLVKRGGIKFVTSFDSEIRALWTGYENNSFVGYALTGRLVYKLFFDDNGEYISRTQLGYIDTSIGKASIFFYRGYYYIIDSDELYVIKSGGIVKATGYAPLYGKDWPTGEVGEVNEPLNTLTRQARISYIVTDPPNIFLCTKYPVASVEAVYVNGERLSSSEYEIDSELNTININLMDPGDKILVYLTYASDSCSLERLKKNTNATVFGGINNSRVFMWSDNSHYMFCSSYVSEEAYAESEAIYSGNGALYFPSMHEFCVGDGSKNIKGVSRHYDRLLIFTEGETWMADSSVNSTELTPILRINSSSGALSNLGIARCENDPVSVDRGRILRWKSNTDELDDCNSYVISEEIKALLNDDFYAQAVAFEDKFHSEVLFARRNDESGKVYVYEEKNGNWYTYDLVALSGFYAGKNNVGFYAGGKLYTFDDSLSFDIYEDGAQKSVSATLSTYPMDFGLPHNKKRLAVLNMLADTDGEDVKISFVSDNGVSSEHIFCGTDSEYVASYSKKLNTDRFVRTSMDIISEADNKQRIYKLAITAKH